MWLVCSSLSLSACVCVCVQGYPVQLVISSQRLSTVALMPQQHATAALELTSFCLHLQLLLLTNQHPVGPGSGARSLVSCPLVTAVNSCDYRPRWSHSSALCLLLHNWLKMFSGALQPPCARFAIHFCGKHSQASKIKETLMWHVFKSVCNFLQCCCNAFACCGNHLCLIICYLCADISLK